MGTNKRRPFMQQANGLPAKRNLERAHVNYRQECLHFTRLMGNWSGALKLPHKEEGFTVSRSGTIHEQF
jgi:hypothetical protein